MTLRVVLDIIMLHQKSCIGAGHRHESIPSSTAVDAEIPKMPAPRGVWPLTSWMITRRLRLIRRSRAIYTSVCSGVRDKRADLPSISRLAPSKPEEVSSTLRFPVKRLSFAHSSPDRPTMPNLTPEGLRIRPMSQRAMGSALTWALTLLGALAQGNGARRSSIIRTAAWDNGRKAEGS